MLAAGSLDDEAFVNALESLRLDPRGFKHRSHLRLGWIYLKQLPLPKTAHRSSRYLRRFAAHHASAGKFHLTMTLAFMQLIYERMQRVTASEPSAEFCARYPDLLNNARGLLALHYSESLPTEPAARSIFVPPDRQVLPAMHK